MMSARFGIVATLALAVTFSTVAYATPIGTSIAINFGADEPAGAGSSVSGAAGLAGTVNWNNLSGATGGPASLIMDAHGVSMPSSAVVSWVSNNTWSSTGRGEDNNAAPTGNDKNLMAGYLDTNATDPAVVTISGLDSVFTAAEYSVAVYIKGGVNNKGGQYTITTPNQVQTAANLQTQAFDGTYVPGENYLVFAGLNAPEFTLTAQPEVGNNPRAPINGIEIVAIPEPSTIVLLGMGIAGLVGLARRRRR